VLIRQAVAARRSGTDACRELGLFVQLPLASKQDIRISVKRGFAALSEGSQYLEIATRRLFRHVFSIAAE
jgi:hypothetical protein